MYMEALLYKYLRPNLLVAYLHSVDVRGNPAKAVKPTC